MKSLDLSFNPLPCNFFLVFPDNQIISSISFTRVTSVLGPSRVIFVMDCFWSQFVKIFLKSSDLGLLLNVTNLHIGARMKVGGWDQNGSTHDQTKLRLSTIHCKQIKPPPKKTSSWNHTLAVDILFCGHGGKGVVYPSVVFPLPAAGCELVRFPSPLATGSGNCGTSNGKWGGEPD